MKDIKDYQVKDRERTLVFKGVQLATSSSYEPWKVRWIELALFRTEGGKYILHGMGKSRVRGETTREWAQVARDPSAVVQRLYMQDDHGGMYLPTVSRQLLAQAGEVDPVVDQAFRIEAVA